MIRPNPNRDLSFGTDFYQRGKRLLNSAQLLRILLIGILSNRELFLIGKVPRINPNFFDPLSRFQSRIWLEMNISNDRYITSSGQQLLFYFLKISRILNRRCRNSYDLTSHFHQFKGLLDRSRRIHRVRGNHTLNPNRMASSNPDFSHFHFTSWPP